ncbi:MAG: hypothetical protein WDN24_06885 [Sphingomonas sp.]
MSQFEFFMTFYGLLLGLAVAELLLGFANLLRHRARPQLGLLTPLLGILVFLQMLAVFIDAWRNLQGIEISMNGLALPTAIGVVLFGVNVIVVPRDPTEWSHLDEYFHANRRWSIGLLILANLLILGNEIPHLGRADIAPYVAFNIFGFSVLGCARCCCGSAWPSPRP